MRKAHLVLAGLIALALAPNARAQNFQSAISGVKPSDVQFKKVDTSGAIGGTSSLTTIGKSPFSLTGFFRRITGLGQPKSVIAPVPAPQYKSSFTPLPPINSTVNR